MKTFDLSEALGVPSLESCIKKVDAKLVELTVSSSESLNVPIKRLMATRGKRLRPSLVIAVAEVYDKNFDDEVLAACAAIELLHISSLVHDDVIDEADTRWNIPTINAKEGFRQAIIAGDYLVAKACHQAATIGSEASGLVTTAFVELCRGQYEELGDQYNVNRTVESYLSCIEGKTSALFAASCQLGALIAGAPAKDLDAWANFGVNFGYSFQIIDDLQDLTGNENMGKKPGNDIKEGVYTLPLLLALEKDRITYEKLIKEGDQSKILAKLQVDGFIAQTIAEIKKRNRLAQKSLDKLSATINSLQGFPLDYFDFSLS